MQTGQGVFPGLLTCGANDRTRTGDLRITSALLYQLSHVGNSTFSSAVTQYIAVQGDTQLRIHDSVKLMGRGFYPHVYRSILLFKRIHERAPERAFFAFCRSKHLQISVFELDFTTHILARFRRFV